MDSTRPGQNLEVVRSVVEGRTPYTPDIGNRTGWKLTVTLCKHNKDLAFWERFNERVMLVSRLKGCTGQPQGGRGTDWR